MQRKQTTQCKPPGSRPLGCAPLLGKDILTATFEDNRPCVQSGLCPYVRFECRRHHTWRAVAGAAACFFCPQCAAMDKDASLLSQGQEGFVPAGTRKRHTLEDVHAVAAQKGGTCLSTEYRGLRVRLIPC